MPLLGRSRSAQRDANNRVPFPSEPPGDFMVVEWDRNLEQWTLHLDDADRSSYNLGRDVDYAMTRFRLWRILEIGCRGLDIAREFGAAQVIFRDGRVIPLKPTPERKPGLRFNDGQENGNGSTGLPPLTSR